MPQVTVATTREYAVAPSANAAQLASAGPKWKLWVPAIIAALLLAAQFHFLFSNLDGRSSVSGEAARLPLATLLTKKNQVRHKFGGTLVWETPESGQTVYRADSVATMSDSNALIEFQDHSQILVEPDSLIVFEEVPAEHAADHKRGVVARLVRGSIVRKKAGTAPLLLKFSRDPNAPEHRFDDVGRNIAGHSAAAVFRVVLNAHGVEVTVESGLITVDGGRSLASGETLPIQIDGGAEKLPAPQLRKPRIEIEPGHKPESSIWDWILPANAWAGDPAHVLVHFEWDEIAKAKGYEIEIASDPKFEKILIEKQVPKAAYVYETDAVQTGNEVYFRVAAIGDKGLVGDYSAVERVEIKNVGPDRTPVVSQQTPMFKPEPKHPLFVGPPLPAKEYRAKAKIDSHPVAKPASSVASKTVAVVKEVKPVEVSPDWRFEVSYGAVYQNRKLDQKGSSQTVSGSGVVPSRLGAEAELLPYGRAGARHNWSLRIGGDYLFETLRTEAFSGTQQNASAPVFRAWMLYEEPVRRGIQIGFGPYLTSTSEVSWIPGGLSTGLKPVLGAMLDLSPDAKTSGAGFRLRTAILAIGAAGADVDASYRYVLSSPLFVGGEALVRLSTVEIAYGGGVELGFSF